MEFMGVFPGKIWTGFTHSGYFRDEDGGGVWRGVADWNAKCVPSFMERTLYKCHPHTFIGLLTKEMTTRKMRDTSEMELALVYTFLVLSIAVAVNKIKVIQVRTAEILDGVMQLPSLVVPARMLHDVIEGRRDYHDLTRQLMELGRRRYHVQIAAFVRNHNNPGPAVMRLPVLFQGQDGVPTRVAVDRNGNILGLVPHNYNEGAPQAEPAMPPNYRPPARGADDLGYRVLETPVIMRPFEGGPVQIVRYERVTKPFNVRLLDIQRNPELLY